MIFFINLSVFDVINTKYNTIFIIFRPKYSHIKRNFSGLAMLFQTTYSKGFTLVSY